VDNFSAAALAASEIGDDKSYHSAPATWTPQHLQSLSRGWVILIRPGSHCLAGSGDF
jgi:hypothetical protein